MIGEELLARALIFLACVGALVLLSLNGCAL